MSLPRPAAAAIRQLKRIRRPWGDLRWPAELEDSAPRSLLSEIELVRSAVEGLSGRSLPPNLTIDVDPAAGEPAALWSGDKVERVVLPAIVLLFPESCRSVLAHELAHLTLFAPACPFLSEGWAVATAYAIEPEATNPFPVKDVGSPVRLRTLGPRRGLRDWLHSSPDDPPFRAPGVFSFERRAGYAHAGSFVRFLLDRYGQEVLTAIFEDLRHGVSPIAALERRCGALQELEDAWEEAAGPSPAPRSDGPSALYPPLSGWRPESEDETRGSISAARNREGGACFLGELAKGAWLSPVVWGRAPTVPPRTIRFAASGNPHAAALLVRTSSAPEPLREFVEVFRPTPHKSDFTVDCRLMFRFFDDKVVFRPEEVTQIGFAVMGPMASPFELHVSAVEVIA